MEWIYFFDLLGCAVFAVSGALVAYSRKMDGVGVLVLAAVTAIGGGTIRDLLLDVPVFWLTDPFYIYVILFSSLLSIKILVLFCLQYLNVFCRFDVTYDTLSLHTDVRVADVIAPGAIDVLVTTGSVDTSLGREAVELAQVVP